MYELRLVSSDLLDDMRLVLALIFVLVATDLSNAHVAFHDPFDVGDPFDPTDPDSPYFLFQFGPSSFADDGVPVQGDGYFRQEIFPFNKTFPQGPTGGFDHVKYLTYTKKSFALKKNGRAEYTLRASALTTGSELHPFGDEDVIHAPGDLRLTSCAANAIDLETCLVTDIFMTNEGIIIFYERLPFCRTVADHYRAFSSMKFVAHRSPGEVHDLTIAYHRTNKHIVYMVDGEEVGRVNNIGHPVTDDPEFRLILDHGGINRIVEPNGFNYGFGCFTLLDMADPYRHELNNGLVKLDDTPNYYVHPTAFTDALSDDASRLFGQGAMIEVHDFKVTVEHAADEDD